MTQPHDMPLPPVESVHDLNEQVEQSDAIVSGLNDTQRERLQNLMNLQAEGEELTYTEMEELKALKGTGDAESASPEYRVAV